MPDYAADDVDVIYARIQEIRKELKFERHCDHTWEQLEGSKHYVCTQCQFIYDDTSFS